MSTDTPALWESNWDLEGSARCIEQHKFARVALQFPDELLRDAVLVFLLADTTYNSLSVDEVAAAHVRADVVIHYGRASLSPLARLPAYYVFGHAPLNLHSCTRKILEYWASPDVRQTSHLLIFLDQPLLWARLRLKELCEPLQEAESPLPLILWAEGIGNYFEPLKDQQPCSNVCGGNFNPKQIERAATAEGPPGQDDQASSGLQAQSDELQEGSAANDRGMHRVAAYQWSKLNTPGKTVSWLWVGAESTAALQQLQWHFQSRDCIWATLNPENGSCLEGNSPDISRSIRRRYFLIEKAKNAAIVGIIVGTLGVAGYLEAAEVMRKLIHAAGKKSYTFLMGKPSPEKLANFPEVEVFVLIADSQGQILDSKAYLAPIITPFEAKMAFTPGWQWKADYQLNFDLRLLGDAEPGSPHRDGVSADHDGDIHAVATQAEGTCDFCPSTSLQLQPDDALISSSDSRSHHLIQVDSAAKYLVAKRSYHGLEAPATGASSKAAEPIRAGMSGRAARYDRE